MNPLLDDLSFISGLSPIVLAIVLIWSLIWKGIALWKSAKKDSKLWFVALLVINTVGILEILYIYVFSEIKLEEIKNSKDLIKNKKSSKNKKNKRL